MILWDPDFKKSIKIYELTNKNLAPDSRGRFFIFLICLFLFDDNLGRLSEEPSAVRAVTLTRRIVVGTRGGEICEIEKDGRIRVSIQGLIIFSSQKKYKKRFRSCRRRNVGCQYSSKEIRNLYC